MPAIDTKLEELGLRIGDAMQLQVSAGDSARRFPVRLIGHHHNTVIVTTPRADGRSLLMREGQAAVLRFAINNAVTGFATRIVASRNSPYPYLHLAVPETIERLEVRKAIRVKTLIEATLTNDSQSQPSRRVSLVDLSPNGGRVETERQMASDGDEITLSLSVEIAEHLQMLTLKGIVRASGEVESKEGPASDGAMPWDAITARFFYGVQFVELTEHESLLLSAFVYQEMLKSLHVI